MKANSEIPPLGKREIAGEVSYNRLLGYVMGFRPLSDYLVINPDGCGSYTIDLDVAGIVGLCAQAVDEKAFDFKCAIANGVLTVAEGRVFLPFAMCTVAAFTQSLEAADSGSMVYVRMSGPAAGQIVLGSGVTHTLQADGYSYRLTLPIARIALESGVWSLEYYHLGAFALATTPYFWIAGYDEDYAQRLVHGAREHGAKWVADSGGGGGSSSSSESSSSSGSGSASASGSSSSGGLAGYFIVTGNAPAAISSAFEGRYDLYSGNPHDGTGVWARDGSTTIYYSGVFGWRLMYLDGYMPVDVAIETNSQTPLEPATWANARATISQEDSYYAYINYIIGA